MSFVNFASNRWPGVEWHGQSDIHVSICWNAVIPMGSDQKEQILALLETNHVGSSIYRFLSKKFDNLVWILNSEEFAAVFLVDCYNHLVGKPDSKSKDKIKNPHTGNYFHRVAVVDDIVCGVRFWCDPYGGDETVLGFRFRITKLDEDEEETRRRTRDEVLEATERMEEIMDMIAEVPEPNAYVKEQAEKMLMTLEDA